MQALWMLAASLAFAVMSAFVKAASAYHSPAELVFYRGLFGVIAIGGFALATGRSLRTPHGAAHAGRGLSGGVSLLMWFYALAHLPLATATTLNYTSPLFVAVLSALIFKRRDERALGLTIALGFVGIVLVLRPAFSGDQALAGLVGAGSGMLAAVAYLSVRRLGELGEPEWRVVFYFSAIIALGCGALMVATGARPITASSAPLLLGIGFCATTAQLALTRAYSRGKTLLASNLAYATVLLSALLGLALWGETLPPVAWAGMALVIASGVIATVRTAQRR
jgi:drug/metabolite transporter (DMT)-like permease